jgi:hypothetical protein
MLGSDPAKANGRITQLKTIAGYALGQSTAVRRVIETGHEVRTLGRNLVKGSPARPRPTCSTTCGPARRMSGFGSSPWLAMRLSPSLRQAYDEIGGRSQRNGFYGLDDAYDHEGEPTGSTRSGPSRGTNSGTVARIVAQIAARIVGSKRQRAASSRAARAKAGGAVRQPTGSATIYAIWEWLCRLA